MRAILCAVLLCDVVTAGAPLAASVCEQSADKSLHAVRGECPSGSDSIQIAGVNLFDQLYVGSSGMNTNVPGQSGGPTTYADAKAALLSAKAHGVRVFRFFAVLFETSQAYWVTNPTKYWQEFDRLMDDIDAAGMYCIPSMGTGMWHHVSNTLHPGLNETLNDGIRNTSSFAYTLNLQYFGEVVARYSSRKSVLFWELGNELNLMVNNPAPWCGPTSTTGTEPCFNTPEMQAYTKGLVAKIRENDAVRPISSGYSAGRSTGWHEEYCKNGSTEPGCETGFYGIDTQEQFFNITTEQSIAVDIISIHHYAPDSPTKPHCYFAKDPSDPNCIYNASLVGVVARLTEALGKMLFVGEYGGPNPFFTGPTVADQQFNQDLLNLQVASSKGVGVSKVGMTAVWAWACPSHRVDMTCIWPGSNRSKEEGSGRMVQLLTEANAALHPPPSSSSASSSSARQPVRISASPRAPWAALDGGDCCPGTTNCTGGKGPYAISTGGDDPSMAGPLCDDTPGCLAFGQMRSFVTHFFFDTTASCVAASKASNPIGFDFKCGGPPAEVLRYHSIEHVVAKLPWLCFTRDNAMDPTSILPARLDE